MMHILQPKHIKLSAKDTDELLSKFNISKAQLPKILSTDIGLPEGCIAGDLIKVERKEPKGSVIDKSQSKEEDKIIVSYRVVV